MSTFNWSQLQNGSDIRGVALEGVADEVVNLTPEITMILGQAFGRWLADATDKSTPDLVIAVGRDSRLSGPALKQGLITGLTALGCRVYDFELASTPAMFMSTVTAGYNCDGAIMLTASHLPFNRNGLKFFTPQGGLGKSDISAILKLAEQLKAEQNDDAAGEIGAVESRDFMQVYAQQLVQMIREGVNHPQHYEQPLQGLKIIVDAGNGAGGFYVNQVLQPLGADTVGSQFLEPDGMFPNHIPNPENEAAIASLQKAVHTHSADFGIIFDTDVDRAGAVDHAGHPLNRNRLIALIAAIVLKERPGTTVVTDSITSDGLTEFIEQTLGGTHHRFKRGYKNVINEAVRLNQTGQPAWLAIETSGHGALKENYFLDDGAYLISKLLVELARTKQIGDPLTTLITSLQEPVESQEIRIKITTEDFQSYGHQVIKALQTWVTQQSDWTLVPNNYEGVRVACSSGWFLLRLSLHDPVLPLNIESELAGGVANIMVRLTPFLKDFKHLELPSESQ